MTHGHVDHDHRDHHDESLSILDHRYNSGGNLPSLLPRSLTVIR